MYLLEQQKDLPGVERTRGKAEEVRKLGRAREGAETIPCTEFLWSNGAVVCSWPVSAQISIRKIMS